MIRVDRNFASRFDDRKRALAKLMASENITVQFIAGAHTASFDTVGRVLTLPDWSTLTIEIIDLLIGHEVGHALFTGPEYLKALKDNPKLHHLMSYFNVIEDARIERKMREAFPGLTRSFYEGYSTFAAKGPILQVKDRKHLLYKGQAD